MTDISSNLDRVIEKLDGMTSEVVAKNYGMDIASKIEHISKQLDYVQSGGSNGNNVMIVKQSFGSSEEEIILDKTYQEIYDHVSNGGFAVMNSRKGFIPVFQFSSYGIIFCRTDINDISSGTHHVETEKFTLSPNRETVYTYSVFDISDANR